MILITSILISQYKHWGNNKKKRAAEGEGPATAETTYPLLVPSRLLRVREARNPQYEGSLKIEKGGSLPPLPGQYRWEGPT